jgi:hypothetical protein
MYTFYLDSFMEFGKFMRDYSIGAPTFAFAFQLLQKITPKGDYYS